MGRVSDLKSAYKQVGVHPADRAFSVIAVQSGPGKVSLFRAMSLMFGQTAAIYGFLRLSRALAHIAALSLSLVVGEFFDDFTQVSQIAVGESSHLSLEWLLSILGWQIAMEEKKRNTPLNLWFGISSHSPR